MNDYSRGTQKFLEDLLGRISEGGFVLVALAFLCFFLYRSALGTLSFVRKIKIREELDHREGDSPKSVAEAFHFELSEVTRQQVTFIAMLAAAAPLLGLLGTVVGMLETFDGLAARAGADTARRVSDGVSIALITTQAGLLMAIPALLLIELIRKQTRQKLGEIAQWARQRQTTSSQSP